jgi:hypothetical protein
MTGSGERERGVLSPADREFLRGDRELSSVQAERNARARIRDRVYDALLDFEVLVEHLDDRDRELVFGKRAGDADGAEAFDAFVSTLAFLYRGLDHTDLDFETVLREGVNLAEAPNDRAATVDYDATYHALDPTHLREKVDAGESLSLTEIAFLYESDDVSRDERAALLGDSRAADVDDGRVQSKVTEF